MLPENSSPVLRNLYSIQVSSQAYTPGVDCFEKSAPGGPLKSHFLHIMNFLIVVPPGWQVE